MGLEVESIRYAHGPGHTDVCYGYDKRYDKYLYNRTTVTDTKLKPKNF